MNILLIGQGIWGTKILATLYQFGQIFTTVATRDNWRDELSSGKYQGVIVATVPESHLEIALAAQELQIPLLLEKPAVLNLSDFNILTTKPWRSPVLVDYIHLFSPKFQELKNKYNSESIFHISSRGTNDGPHRTYSSLWDYGPHDLSMILDLLQEEPKTKSCYRLLTSFGELFEINMKFSRGATHSIVGSGDYKKQSWLKINDVDVYDSQGQPPVLPEVLKVFISIIRGAEDYRSGWNLTQKITKILDFSRT